MKSGRLGSRLGMGVGLVFAFGAGMAVWMAMPGAALYEDEGAVPGGGKAPLTELAARAEQVVRGRMVAGSTPGVSVAVGRDGAVVWSEGFGWAELKGRERVTRETKFRLGTGSRALTAAAVGVLVEQGRLGLDDEIQRAAPEWGQKRWRVTARQLMEEKGGLVDGPEDEEPLARMRCAGPREALGKIGELGYEPGTRAEPSARGWVVLSAAVEGAAGRPFGEFVRSAVLEPLGLKRTGVESAAEENPDRVGEEEEDAPFMKLGHQVLGGLLGWDEVTARRAGSPAVVYERGFKPGGVWKQRLHEEPVRNLSCLAGALGYYSTAEDVVRLAMGEKTAAAVPGLRGGDGVVEWTLHGRSVGALVRGHGVVVAVLMNGGTVEPKAVAKAVAEVFGRR